MYGTQMSECAELSMPSEIVSPARVPAIDIFRGLIMVLMALDHTRDFFTNLSFEAEALAQTNLALFATRWVTHLCARCFSSSPERALSFMGCADRVQNFAVFFGHVAFGSSCSSSLLWGRLGLSVYPGDSLE